MKPILSFLLYFSANVALSGEWSGHIAAEWRYFPHTPDATVYQHNAALALQSEYYHRFEDSRSSFTFTPFFRLDENDDERTHADIREFYWHWVARDWELKTGIGKVFWGKTETLHLVDIINQTDALENIDGEDKLGQPMLNFTWVSERGLLDIFVLPGFRERPFPAPDGRPHLTGMPIAHDHAIYDSDKKQHHIDTALRWSQTLGIWDIGMAHFTGTSREPRFNPAHTVNGTNGQTRLIPIYDLIQQTTVDLQTTFPSWLWKAEIMLRNGQAQRYYAAVSGIEYTFTGVFASQTDLGIIAEYLYDERGTQASTPFANDLAMGARIALNDMQSTQALFGIIRDLDTQSNTYFIEASRRLGQRYTLNFELRGAAHIQRDRALQALKNEGFTQLELVYYF